MSRVRVGMTLGRSVLDSTGNVLLRAGVTLTSAYIARVKELGYPALYIRSPWDQDDLDIVEPVRFVTRMRAQAALQQLASDLTVKSLSPERLDAVSESVHAILEEVMVGRDLLLNMMEIRSFDGYTFGHSVNTCVLSLMAGVSLGLARGKLIDLGVGTLLHDLGKMFIPADILNKPSSLTPQEYAIVQDHCQRGYNLLRDCISPPAAHVAYQHHERCDGGGYPRQLKHDEILFFAKIAAVADSLDAMTSDRAYSSAMLPERAAAVLRDEAPRKYDPECVATVTRLVAPYPIGCVVRLETGEVGEVVNATRTRIHVFVTRGARRGETVACPDDGRILGTEKGGG